MKVFAQFYGGHSYAFPYPHEFEIFKSIKEAKDVFKNRIDFNLKYPCIDETASMQIYFSQRDYPDRILKIGKKGGIVYERC